MPFTQELADSICSELANGLSLRKACEKHEISHCTWLDWVRADEKLANQYARAKEVGQEARFETLRDKASAEPERDQNGRIDPGWVAWKRLEIDTEKWTLAKQEPKKYGDKLDLNHSGGIKIAKELTEDELQRIASSGGA